MIQFIGVLLAWISKWYKSNRHRHHRRIGFLLTLFVATYFMIYFLYLKFWWLALYNVTNIFFGLRGTKNNWR